MGTLGEKISQWIASEVGKLVMDIFTTITALVANITQFISESSNMSLSAFSGEMFGFASTITQSVILPIAGVVLSYVAITNLIQIINDKNTFYDNEVQSLFKWLVRTAIAIILVSNSFAITNAFFEVGVQIVDNAGTVTSSNYDQDALMEIVENSVDEHVEEGNWGTLALQGAGGFLALIMTYIASAIVPVIVYVRFFKMYLYLAIGSVPMSTLTQGRVSSIGENYVRNILALAFQALMMLLVVVMYSLFLTNTLSATLSKGNIMALVGMFITASFLLIILLFQTEAISKSIFNAS